MCGLTRLFLDVSHESQGSICRDKKNVIPSRLLNGSPSRVQTPEIILIPLLLQLTSLIDPMRSHSVRLHESYSMEIISWILNKSQNIDIFIIPGNNLKSVFQFVSVKHGEMLSLIRKSQRWTSWWWMMQVVRTNLWRSPRKCGFLSTISLPSPVIRWEGYNS